MNLIKNYKLLKGMNFEEFQAVKVKHDEDEVFADLPYCQVDYSEKADVLYLINSPEITLPIAIKLDALKRLIASTKLFYLSQDDKGAFREVEPGTHQYVWRFPKDTNISKLTIVNGQIGMVDTEADKVIEEPANKGE